MITNKVDSSSRYAYLKWDGSSFSYRASGISMDGNDLLDSPFNSS